MQDLTYLQAMYVKIATIDEECKQAVEGIVRIDFLTVLLEEIKKRAEEAEQQKG